MYGGTMETPFLPLKEAALLAKTDLHYLHKLAKAGKVTARTEKRGKLNYWYIDTSCSRFIQLKERTLINQFDRSKAPIKAVEDKFSIDWSLWEDMCRAGEEIVKAPYSEKTLKETRRYINVFFSEYSELTRDNLRDALKAYDKKASADKDCYSSKKWLYQSMMTVARYYEYKKLAPSEFVHNLQFVRPRKTMRQPKRHFHTEKTVRKVLSELKTAKNKRGLRAFTYLDEALNEALIKLLFMTGARADEACNIRKTDIEYQRSRLKLRGKGKKDRVVGLCAEVKQAMKDYWRERPHVESDYFFLHSKGKPLTPNYIRRRLLRVAEYSNIQKFTPHPLRRTFTRWAIQDKKLSMITVRDALGHSTLTMTNIYANTIEDDVVNAMKNF
jgi:integrase